MPVGGFLDEAKRRALALGGAVLNTQQGQNVNTGMNDPSVQLIAGAVPGPMAIESQTLGEAAANSPAAKAIQSLKNRMSSMIPNTASAGEKFQTVMSAAKDVPLDTTSAQEIVQRAQELRQRGSTLPKVLNDFIKGSGPDSAPLTYEAGRDFASNAGALSTRETTAMNSKMQRQVTQFAVAMKDANRAAAEQVGMGDVYDAAMKEYRQAKNLQQAKEVLTKWAVRGAAAMALGASGVAGVKLYQDLTK